VKTHSYGWNWRAWAGWIQRQPKRPYLTDGRLSLMRADLPAKPLVYCKKGRNAANISGRCFRYGVGINIAISMVKNPLTGNFDTAHARGIGFSAEEGINMFQFLNRVTGPSDTWRWIAAQ